MAICKVCGHENADDQSFCESCGSALETEELLEKYSVDEPFSSESLGASAVTPEDNYNDYKTVCLLGMIFGIAAFLINPLYLVSIAGIVLGIIGHLNSVNYKNWAMAGWICGAVSLVLQFLFDLLCTGGIGFFC